MLDLFKTLTAIWIINAIFVLNVQGDEKLKLIKQGGYYHNYTKNFDEASKPIGIKCLDRVCKIPCGYNHSSKEHKFVELNVTSYKIPFQNEDKFKLSMDINNMNLLPDNISLNNINVTLTNPKVKCTNLIKKGNKLRCDGITNYFDDTEIKIYLWYGLDTCRKSIHLGDLPFSNRKKFYVTVIEDRGYYDKNLSKLNIDVYNKLCSGNLCKWPCKNESTIDNSYVFKDVKLINKKHKISYQTHKRFGMVFWIQNFDFILDDISENVNNLSMSFNTTRIKCDNLKKIGVRLFCNGTVDFGKTNKLFFKAFFTYGLPNCRRVFELGVFKFSYKRTKYIYIILIISILITVLIGSLIAIVIIHKKRVAMQKWAKQKDEQQASQNAQYIKLQKKAFLEYQTAVNSFQHLGNLTALHVNDFKYYTTKILNLQFTNNISNIKVDAELEGIILNINELAQWINAIDSTLTAQTKTKISAILTIVLFKHPREFIELLKMLINQSVKDLLQKNEEKLFFRRTGCMTEKLVANWLTLCMYESLQTGEIGRRYFNLCRAIKCKLDTGPVDALTNNSKNCLSFENMLLDDMTYDNLTVVASVNVLVCLTGDDDPKTRIEMSDFEVNVLSIDTISQVKSKVLDRALMLYAEKLQNECENIDNIPKNIQFPVSSNFLLYFVKDPVKLLLEDIDRTSILISKDPQIRKLNTMKHFNIKDNNNFLLTSEQINVPTPMSPIESQYTIHLEWPENLSNIDSPQNLNKNSYSKLISPANVYNELTKEAYIMILMATKKSIYPFLEGFFQCLLNVRPKLDGTTSSISLFESQTPLASTPLINIESCDSVKLNLEPEKAFQSSYLVPVHFLFNVLENAARDFQISDTQVINAWKINSFILRFWVNLIKNPEFVFGGFVKTVGFNDSLTTVSTVLIESCSSKQNAHLDINSPVIKTLFHEEAKEKFPKWWNSFSERVSCIPEESVIEVMKSITKKFNIQNEYNDSLKQLKEYVEQYCTVHYPSMNKYIKSQNIS